MRETWYVLEDGSAVDPREVDFNEDGKLAHKNGLVKMRFPDCPWSRSVDVDKKSKAEEPAASEPKPAEVVNAALSGAQSEVVAESREVVPEQPKRAGKTRKN